MEILQQLCIDVIDFQKDLGQCFTKPIGLMYRVKQFKFPPIESYNIFFKLANVLLRSR
jgi:hypothetical protein